MGYNSWKNTGWYYLPKWVRNYIFGVSGDTVITFQFHIITSDQSGAIKCGCYLVLFVYFLQCWLHSKWNRTVQLSFWLNVLMWGGLLVTRKTNQIKQKRSNEPQKMLQKKDKHAADFPPGTFRHCRKNETNRFSLSLLWGEFRGLGKSPNLLCSLVFLLD